MQETPTQDTPKQDKAASKKAPAKAKKALVKKSPSPQAKQKTSSGVAWLAVVLVVFATGAGYLAFTQLEQRLDQVSKRTDEAKKSTSELSNKLQSNTKEVSIEVVDLSKQLSELQQSSSEKIALLQKQVGKNRRQWLIAEAEYLTSIANTRLQLVGDVDTAIIALQAADQRLKENGDPMTFAVRKQLAKEINILKGTELPDTVGISSQILALEDAVSNMGVSNPHAGTAQAVQIGKAAPSPLPENIQETLNEAWENFSKLIVVRRHDKPMAALMTPERVELIRKNLALKLESARLALINQNQALYTASIAISIKWLGDYFDANKPSVKTAIEQLNELKNTAIKVELPSIALSLKMLRDLPLLTIADQIEPALSTQTTVEKVTTPAVEAAVKKAPTEKPATKEKAATSVDESIKAGH